MYKVPLRESLELTKEDKIIVKLKGKKKTKIANAPRSRQVAPTRLWFSTLDRVSGGSGLDIRQRFSPAPFRADWCFGKRRCNNIWREGYAAEGPTPFWAWQPDSCRLEDVNPD